MLVRDAEMMSELVDDRPPDRLFYIIIRTADAFDVIFEYRYLVGKDIAVIMCPFGERHALVENRAGVVHGANRLTDDAQEHHRRRMKMKNRFDIGTGFIDRLVQGRLRHRFVEVDEK